MFLFKQEHIQENVQVSLYSIVFTMIILKVLYVYSTELL